MSIACLGKAGKMQAGCGQSSRGVDANAVATKAAVLKDRDGEERG